jgi:pSer/pThr/pTyr-binding forkhead associated (FHA) protein
VAASVAREAGARRPVSIALSAAAPVGGFPDAATWLGCKTSRVTEAVLILGDGRELLLGDDFSIGRAPENSLTIERKTVSRQHAVITASGGRWFIEDRGSFNGTSINGARIQPGAKLPLRHGDRIGLGVESLVFSAPDQLEDPEATTPLDHAPPELTRPLSPFQQQVVTALCEGWLNGGTLDDLPTNEEIAARIGTPGATETVKAALRRAYAKAGLTSGSPYAKRRALCKIARQRGWI